jgi:hypothetical protein
VLLCHEDAAVVQADFDKIVSMQPTLFTVKEPTFSVDDEDIAASGGGESKVEEYDQHSADWQHDSVVVNAPASAITATSVPLTQALKLFITRLIVISLSAYGVSNVFVVLIPFIFPEYS